MKYMMRLYITGDSPISANALKNIEKICREDLDAAYELEVIDIEEQTGMAEKDKIVATPSLVKEIPPPVKVLVGDMSERESVLFAMDIVKK